MAANKFDHRLSTTLLICVVYPLGPAAIILMPMLVGGLVDNYGYSEQQAATIASLEGLGVVVSSVLATFWIRRVSWLKALTLSFLLYAALNAVSANVSEFTPLLVARFLTGFAGGGIFAVAVAALGDNREPDRAFGLAQAVQGVLMMAAFAAAPYLVQAWGVGALYYLLAAGSIVMMLTLLRFPAAGEIRAVSTGGEEAGGSHTVLIWLGLLASVIFFINIFGFWTFVERIGQAAGLPLNTIGLALGASQIMAIVGALAAAAASHRYGRALPLIIVLVGQALTLFVLIGKFGATVFFVSTGIFQALFFLGVSYQMGAIAKLDLKGRFLVLMTAAQGLGAAFGPSIAAALIRGDDYGGVLYMAAVCCLLSTLIFLFIVHRSRHVPDIAGHD